MDVQSKVVDLSLEPVVPFGEHQRHNQRVYLGDEDYEFLEIAVHSVVRLLQTVNQYASILYYLLEGVDKPTFHLLTVILLLLREFILPLIFDHPAAEHLEDHLVCSLLVEYL